MGKRKERTKSRNIAKPFWVTLSINLNLISAYSQVKPNLRMQLWIYY